jgi:hypothetical protein
VNRNLSPPCNTSPRTSTIPSLHGWWTTCYTQRTARPKVRARTGRALSIDPIALLCSTEAHLSRTRRFSAGYHHPSGNQEFLEHQLLPVLRAGLEALVVQMEVRHEVPSWVVDTQEAGAYSSMRLTECTDDCVVRRAQEERTKVASWEEFPDGVLPDVWSPFCPIKWLAQYLHQHNPTLRYEAPVTPKQWNQLSREEKVEMCFTHLDRDGNGTQPQPIQTTTARVFLMRVQRTKHTDHHRASLTVVLCLHTTDSLVLVRHVARRVSHSERIAGADHQEQLPV